MTTPVRFPVLHTLALLGLCAAYIQGGLTKLLDFQNSVQEMNHFGLHPAWFFASGVCAFELIASALVILNHYRILAALALAGFTLFATLLAARFWELSGVARFQAENTFFEHLGLVGGFLLVAWIEFNRGRWRRAPETA